MRILVIFFITFLIAIRISFPVNAVPTPPVDDIEMMLKKIEKNLQVASQVTQVAQKTSEKLVETKVEEKAELKEAVVLAEKKVEAISQVNEMYAIKMISAGIDTAVIVAEEAEAKFMGPVYEAFLKYQKEGGDADFEYFRLYLYK